jgi:GAG-pre-integrase domain
MYVKNCLNIVSVSALDNNEISTTFKQGICFLVDENDQDQLGFGLLKDEGIYTSVGRGVVAEYEPTETVKAIMAAAQTEKCQKKYPVSRVHLWHRRLGHANKKAVNFMLDHKTADDMDAVQPDEVDCGSCAKGKQAKMPQNGNLVRPDAKSGDAYFQTCADLCPPCRWVEQDTLLHSLMVRQDLAQLG